MKELHFSDFPRDEYLAWATEVCDITLITTIEFWRTV